MFRAASSSWKETNTSKFLDVCQGVGLCLLFGLTIIALVVPFGMGLVIIFMKSTLPLGELLRSTTLYDFLNGAGLWFVIPMGVGGVLLGIVAIAQSSSDTGSVDFKLSLLFLTVSAVALAIIVVGKIISG